MKEHQTDYQSFVDERPNLSRSPWHMQWRIHEEAEELLEEMNDPAEMTPEQTEALASELADIYMFTLGIANHYGVDLDAAFRKKLEFNKERFHPSETYAESKAREGKPIREIDVYYNESVSVRPDESLD